MKAHFLISHLSDLGGKSFQYQLLIIRMQMLTILNVKQDLSIFTSMNGKPALTDCRNDTRAFVEENHCDISIDHKNR